TLGKKTSSKELNNLAATEAAPATSRESVVLTSNASEGDAHERSGSRTISKRSKPNAITSSTSFTSTPNATSASSSVPPLLSAASGSFIMPPLPEGENPSPRAVSEDSEKAA